MKYFPGLVVGLMVAFTPPLAGHPATERYIPIGGSPGISGEQVAGPISDRESNQMEVAGRNLVITDTTKIYLDRSQSGRTSIEGRPEDCSAGQYVEVKFRDEDGRRVAEWIKVRAQ